MDLAGGLPIQTGLGTSGGQLEPQSLKPRLIPDAETQCGCGLQMYGPWLSGCHRSSCAAEVEVHTARAIASARGPRGVPRRRAGHDGRRDPLI